MVTCHYHGTLPDGSVFDSSVEKKKPFKFQLGQGQVIRGWDEGMAQLQKGQKAILICPPKYAYGDRGYPPVIPPNTTLKFEVEVLDFEVPALCSHILIKHKDCSNPYCTRKKKDITRTKEEALKTVNMLIDSINKGQEFAKIAQAFSECPSGDEGGNLGHITKS